MCGYRIAVIHNLPKVGTRVRLSVPAPIWHDLSMSTTIKDAAKDAIKSRFFVGLTVLLLIEMLVMLIIALTQVRTGLTIKTHCEIVGRAAIDCTSADAPWYYIFNFVALPVVVFIVNVLVSLKLLARKGRQLALCWLWLTLLIGLVVTALGSAMVLRVA